MSELTLPPKELSKLWNAQNVFVMCSLISWRVNDCHLVPSLMWLLITGFSIVLNILVTRKELHKHAKYLLFTPVNNDLPGDKLGKSNYVWKKNQCLVCHWTLNVKSAAFLMGHNNCRSHFTATRGSRKGQQEEMKQYFSENPSQQRAKQALKLVNDVWIR